MSAPLQYDNNHDAITQC